MLNLSTLSASLLLLVLCGSKLIFYDDFDKLDFRKWKHELTMCGGGNNEFEMYENNRTITYTNNSILYIQPILTEEKIGANAVRNGSTFDLWGGSPGDFCTAPFNEGCKKSSNGYNYLPPIQSGKLTTVQSLSFTYGRVEVRAKLPKGDWLWPAIWMLPRYIEYGGWPNSGEIDIMESRGNVGYPLSQGGGPESYGSTLHWGTNGDTNQYLQTHEVYTLKKGSFADEFHTFGLYWDNKVIYTYLDNDTNRILFVNHTSTSYWERSGIKGETNPWQWSKNKCAPFDTDFYLVLNVAVGGSGGYWPDGVGNKPWSDDSDRPAEEFYDNKGQWYPTWKKQDSAMQVDWVKVWDLEGNDGEKQ